MTPVTALIVGLFGGGAAALVAYLTMNRKLSGKIDTTEASELWAESARMRDDYRGQIAALAARVDKLEKMNSDLVKENSELARENQRLTRKVEALELENARLAERVAELEATQTGREP